MASGGRYYIVDGERISEAEYERRQKKAAKKAEKTTPKSGSPAAAESTSKPSKSEE